MKKAQLVAVIIIVILVAAVIVSFVIFSGKKAERAATLSAPSPKTITAPKTPPATTAPPPAASTTSSEIVTDTTDCKVTSADCVSYVMKDGTPDTLCIYTEALGCYHSYACSPRGELVQKETPAYCGMVGPAPPSTS